MILNDLKMNQICLGSRIELDSTCYEELSFHLVDFYESNRMGSHVNLCPFAVTYLPLYERRFIYVPKHVVRYDVRAILSTFEIASRDSHSGVSFIH